MSKANFLCGIRDLVICLLLFLAAAHCTLSIFYDNESWIDLRAYAAGKERNPFQERIAMIPIIRLSENSPAIQHLAYWLDRRAHRMVPGEPLTPEKFVSLCVALCSVLATLAACVLYGRRTTPGVWWLPSVIAIGILYVSYAARYQHALWYPYDLPHMFFFGMACASILSGQLGLFLFFFLWDLPFRETSIYLIVLSFSSFAFQLRRRWFVVLACFLTLAWIAVRISIVHRFHANPSEAGSHLAANLGALVSPFHWPTLASSVGFLLIPVWLGRKHLNDTERRFLWFSIPCFLVSVYFGILIETRVFVEWTIPFALLASAEATRALLPHTLGPQQLVIPEALA
jgi:hypothetical protein